MEELNEAHASLRHAPREQTIGGESPGLARLRAVELERVFGLLRKIGQRRHRALHLVGHLVLGDARGNLGIAELLELDLIELAEVVDESAPLLGSEAGRIGEIEHRIPERAEFDALILGGKESTAPLAIGERL